MEAIKKQRTVQALLDEYRKAVNELQKVIENISNVDLCKIADAETHNVECRSIQSILTHVISSGYSYCVYIQNHKHIPAQRPEPKIRFSSAAYSEDLDDLLAYTKKAFSDIYDNELEVFDNRDKIETKWGQYYDFEQMMEHAIVHILRHRRQIENFKVLLQPA